MIEAGDGFGFAPKTHQSLVRIDLMSEDALHGDNASGVLLSCAINHSHSAAPDFFQNFVMTESPGRIGHVRFCEDALERFTRCLTFGFESFLQETVDACPVITPSNSAAAWTLLRALAYVRG